MNKAEVFKKYFLYFLMYSIFGWCYEVFLEVVLYRWGYSDRGILTGPYSPVYGVGALIFIVCLGRLKKKGVRIGKINLTPILIFLGVMLIATAVELVTTYIMEASVGSWPWDYHRFAFDFQGRIALNPSIRFGIGGTVFLYVLQPFFEKITEKMSGKVLNVVFSTLFMLFMVDFVHYLIY